MGQFFQVWLKVGLTSPGKRNKKKEKRKERKEKRKKKRKNPKS